MADPITQVIQSLGLVTAYGYAKSKGYTGTEEEFAEAAAAIGQGAATATAAAEAASEDAETATTAAGTATTKATAAATSASEAYGYMQGAEAASGDATTAKNAAEGYASTASAKATAAAYSEYNAGLAAGASQDYSLVSQDHSETSEAWAVGTKNGNDVPADADQYHNNAKYYAEQASGDVSSAEAQATAAAASATAAAGSAAAAEAWATGGSGGTAGATNNAEYWASQAETAAVAGTAALANEAPVFDATKAYSAGDYVLYDSVLYRFTVDHAAGAWTGTDAAAVKIGSDITELKSALTLNNILSDEYFTIPKQYVNASGLTRNSNNTKRTDYISCDAGSMIIFHGKSFIYAGEPAMSMIAFYDENKTFISSITRFNDETVSTDGSVTVVVPQNTAYVICSTNTNTTETASLSIAHNSYLIPDMFSGSDSDKIQACLDLLSSNGGTIIINRKYELTANLINKLNTDASDKKSIAFMGLGKNQGLRMNGYSFVSNLSNAAIGGLRFFNVDFEGTNIFANTNCLIRLFFNNCRFHGFNYVIYGEGITQSLYFSQCYFEDIGVSVFSNISDGVWNVAFHECVCENSNRFYDGDYPSASNGNYNVVIRDCCIEGIANSAIYLSGNSHNIIVEGCYFEAALPINLSRCGTYAENIAIQNNVFFLAANTPAIILPNNNSTDDRCRGVISNNACIPNTAYLAKIGAGSEQNNPIRFQFTQNTGVIDTTLELISYEPIYGKVIVSNYTGDLSANEEILLDDTADFRRAISITLKKQATPTNDYNIGGFIYVKTSNGYLYYVNGSTPTDIQIEAVSIMPDS